MQSELQAQEEGRLSIWHDQKAMKETPDYLCINNVN